MRAASLNGSLEIVCECLLVGERTRDRIRVDARGGGVIR